MYTDILIDDFEHPAFREAFQVYFTEMGETVKDWAAFFRKMNDDENDNKAFLRLDPAGHAIGFIQFCEMESANWFFKEKMGFIREFWVEQPHRGKGHGAQLLHLAESYFLSCGVRKMILTSDTAEGFYRKQGYRIAVSVCAENEMPVFVKEME